MYNFQKQAIEIINNARSYGVTVVLINGRLQFEGKYKGSDSVEMHLEKKIATYNQHVQQGY